MLVFLFIGFPEISIIILIYILLFGTGKIPELARTLGRLTRAVKDTTDEMKREILKPVETLETEVNNLELNKHLEQQLDDIQKPIEDIAGTIKRDSL